MAKDGPSGSFSRNWRGLGTSILLFPFACLVRAERFSRTMRILIYFSVGMIPPIVPIVIYSLASEELV
jgi:hypothetical protein